MPIDQFGRNLEIVGGGDPYFAIAGAEGMDLARLLAISGAAVPEGMQEQVMADRLARSAVVVREGVPLKARRYPLGFDSVDPLVPDVTTTINSQPQITFRAERLVVPSDIAGSFVINDFQVGKNSQFANDVAVPARIFDEQAVQVELRGDTAQTSQNVVLKVTNQSGANIRFRACVVGTALDT